MNTKMNFSCIEISQGDITRYDLEVIKDFNSDHFSEWLDNSISYICNLFDFNLVLDWNINNYEETLEDITEVTIINTCSGRIIFDDDLDQKILALKAENYELLKKKLEYLQKEKEEKKVESKKDYPSCWIDLFGKVYYLAFAEHNSWALHYLKTTNPEMFDEFGITLKNSYKDAYVVLEEMGWIRILGWKDPPCFVLPDNITPKQKQSLREYCIKEGLKYADFPEILKS